MKKTRINWTINQDVLNILKQASKLDPRRPSFSTLVEYAVVNTFVNKIEQLRERRKALAREMYSLDEQIQALEQVKE